jgi:hypothetical protein
VPAIALSPFPPNWLLLGGISQWLPLSPETLSHTGLSNVFKENAGIPRNRAELEGEMSLSQS